MYSRLPQLVEQTVLCRLTWFEIKNGVQRLSVVGDLLVETSQVELVLYIVLINLIQVNHRIMPAMITIESSLFVYLTKKLVPAQGAEP